MKLQVMKNMKSLPGPRYRDQGQGSGEEFRDVYLIPAFDEALEKGEKLFVDMDGAEYGYPTTFLEEAFGGLARKRGRDSVISILRIVCIDEPLLEKEIEHYINFGERERTPSFEISGA